jgi:Na+/glutamate symporter
MNAVATLASLALYLVGGFVATAVVGHVWGVHAGAEVMAANALLGFALIPGILIGRPLVRWIARRWRSHNYRIRRYA